MNFKVFIQDKRAVFASIVLLLFTLFTVLLVVLRVDTTQSVAIIRNNTTLGLAGFAKADSNELYQLALIPVLAAVTHILLAVRLQESNRFLSLLSLVLGCIVVVFSAVVSSAILGLHR